MNFERMVKRKEKERKNLKANYDALDKQACDGMGIHRKLAYETNVPLKAH